jgi:hypothetical protein
VRRLTATSFLVRGIQRVAAYAMYQDGHSHPIQIGRAGGRLGGNSGRRAVAEKGNSARNCWSSWGYLFHYSFRLDNSVTNQAIMNSNVCSTLWGPTEQMADYKPPLIICGLFGMGSKAPNSRRVAMRGAFPPTGQCWSATHFPRTGFVDQRRSSDPQRHSFASISVGAYIYIYIYIFFCCTEMKH